LTWLFRTLSYYPDDQLAVIALANVNGSAPGDIASKAAIIELGGTVELPSERKEISLTQEQINAIVGTYSLAPGIDLSVFVEEGKLLTQLTGQGKLPLFAESPTLLFLKVVDAQLELPRTPPAKLIRWLCIRAAGIKSRKGRATISRLPNGKK
jgi:hypothetical protein